MFGNFVNRQSLCSRIKAVREGLCCCRESVLILTPAGVSKGRRVQEKESQRGTKNQGGGWVA